MPLLSLNKAATCITQILRLKLYALVCMQHPVALMSSLVKLNLYEQLENVKWQ